MGKFLWFILGLAICGACAAKSMSTIWETELALGGVHHGDSKKSVLQRLGKPDSIDDPRKFKFSTMAYPDLTITLGEGGDGVIFVRSSSSKYCTPSGICPGMLFSKAEAAYSSIHISERAEGGKFTAYFGSKLACRLTFEVEQGVIKSLGAGCMPW